MLKRDKLAHAIMSTDFDVFFKRRTQQNSALLDAWVQHACAVTKVGDQDSPYAVLAVDGSQIYPDRHLSDSGCFLVNTGGCYLAYGQASVAQFFSEPHLFFDEQISQELEAFFSPDIVDLKREELEFWTALEQSIVLRTGQTNFVCLFDGSLIFGHLENKPDKIKKYYVKKYLEILGKFHDKNILIASYISLPASKDLVTQFEAQMGNDGASHGLCDVHVLSRTLPIGYRTKLFCNNSGITEFYPENLKPYFFYINTGQEIARTEVPAWVAKNENNINFIAQVCLNQCIKGFGYPVALAEAHEQAVVRAADRDFFYHLIQRKNIQLCKPVTYSQKIIKKQGMGF